MEKVGSKKIMVQMLQQKATVLVMQYHQGTKRLRLLVNEGKMPALGLLEYGNSEALNNLVDLGKRNAVVEPNELRKNIRELNQDLQKMENKIVELN